ncbi:zinc transport system substrate-binding protein [Lachnospiraceae bacterium NE2001]|nr:zinc transport system substrate-binding protein [Lachnospiraceae bacterium NE2001]
MKKNIFELVVNKVNIKRFVSFVMLGSMVFGLSACGSDTANANASLANGADSNGKLQVVTTIFPEYDWVREIVGQGENSVDTSAADDVEITMLLDNGVDLHSYQPTAADIARISTCDVFIYVGGESDAWVDDALKEAANKDMVVINLLDVLGETVKEEEIVEGMEVEEEEEDHEHEASEEEASMEDADEDGHHHDEGEIEYDEHVWLSLKDAKILTQDIADRISSVDAENAEAYKANVTAYNEKLSALDADYQSAADKAKVDTILFGDRFPFRYMVDDYGINYYAAFVGCSAETEASFETIIFLAGKVDELGLPAICTIEKSDQKIAETVKNNTKSQDQKILTLDSLQSVTSTDVAAGETYLKKMTDNLDVLKQALNVE